MNNTTTFANREVLDLTICDYKTQKPILFFPFANATSTSIQGEAVYAYGGQGHPKRVAFYGEKGGTFTIETQMMSAQLYSILTGAEIEKSASFIKRVEAVAKDGVITLTDDAAKISEGSVSVYALNDDCGTPVKATVAGNAITLEDVSSNDTYIVYYLEKIESGVRKIAIKSSTFPKAVSMYGETYNKTEDEEIVPYKLRVYKAAPQINFEMGFSNSGDPTSTTITFDLMADQNDNMMDMILIDEESVH